MTPEAYGVALFILAVSALIVQSRVLVKREKQILKLRSKLYSAEHEAANLFDYYTDSDDTLARCRQDNIDMMSRIAQLKTELQAAKEEAKRYERESYKG